MSVKVWIKSFSINVGVIYVSTYFTQSNNNSFLEKYDIFKNI